MLPVPYLRQLRGGVCFQFPPSRDRLERHGDLAPQTPPARQVRLDRLHPLRPLSFVGDPQLQPTEFLSDLSLPSSTDSLLSSGCGSPTSVQPSFLLNKEVVCPFLCVSGSLTHSIGIPGSLESLESSSGQRWYKKPESQSSCTPWLLSQRALLQEPIRSPPNPGIGSSSGAPIS